ncbi:hypothetical protein MIND_00668300 [Mycena indigotica]|uniref:Uncharacterized protein n=1 Tax=Mycena indigotica TaxID=2126181 RepID=A0A8H6SNH4_9AGAR|nr:uncharacterized protein MIND_00668300 [Mycena indigotica]KAF7301045.1 hypothetical protein MIND_00668300 [Mycena indigotica]
MMQATTAILSYLFFTMFGVWLSLKPHKGGRRGWSLGAVIATYTVIKRFPIEFDFPSIPRTLSSVFSLFREDAFSELRETAGPDPVLLGLASHLVCFMVAHFSRRVYRSMHLQFDVHVSVWVIPLAVNLSHARLNGTFWLLYQVGCVGRFFPSVRQLRRGILYIGQLSIAPTVGEANAKVIAGSILANTIVFGIDSVVRVSRILPVASPHLFRLYPLVECMALCAFFTGAWCIFFPVFCAMQLSVSPHPSHQALFRHLMSRPTLAWHARTRDLWGHVMSDLDAFQIVQRWDFDYLLLERRRVFAAWLESLPVQWSALPGTHKLVVILPAVVFHATPYIMPMIGHMPGENEINLGSRRVSEL